MLGFSVYATYGVSNEAVRKETRHRVATHLFPALGAQHAYVRAVEMSGGFHDAHNDGPGDRTNFMCLGIHDLDAVHLGSGTLTEELANLYGVDVGMVDFDVGVPKIIPRE
ncbi:hypothetical protein [Janthinobacterium sp. BJB446]|uniref:hypothetical protein n=1 Tax=Janthinobacterium sp. BJB446 TaxID=2048009 RepID=UPI00117A48B5|nr:hypothetical protein [Janthinobacterium sp. BJB446]